MWHIATLGLGTRGDLYPLLGISRTLVERGCEVDVLEYDEYEPDVVGAGLNFVCVGRGSQCAEVFANVPIGPATRRTEWTTDRLYCEASLRSARAFVAQLTGRHRRPDAIIAPAYHIGALLSSELLEVPLVSVFLGTSTLASFDVRTPSGLGSRSDQRMMALIDRLVLPRLADLRRDIGIRPGQAKPTFARVDRGGGVVLTTAALAPTTDSIPPTFDVVGYPDYYGPHSRQLDESTRQFLTGVDLPVIVCSLGDGWAHQLPEQLRRLADRAEEGRYRLLVVGGRTRGPAQGRYTRVVSGVSLMTVLGCADVSVNHGGMGTLIAALRNEVPSVVVSQWPDGRRNGAMLAAQRLGTDLGSAPTVEDLYRAVDTTLVDTTIRCRLRAARSAMRAEPDPATAVQNRLDRQS